MQNPLTFSLSRLGTQADADEALESLNVETERLRIHVLAVKSHRNSLAPISRLPPELLSEVFVWLVSNFAIRDFGDKREQRPRYHRWIVVTFICRHWREVALRTPRMWNRITLHGKPERITTFLQRSAQAPLEVYRPFDVDIHRQHVPKQLLELVIENLKRVKRLDIRLNKLLLDLVVAHGFSAPMLEDLGIVSNLPGVEPADFPHFSGAYLPRLKKIGYEHGSAALLNSILRPTLTDLTIVHPLHTQPAGSIVALIQGLPLLERLSLTNAVSQPSLPVNRLPPVGRQVTLPHLKSLRLWERGIGTACADFLNHLLIPASAIRELIGDEPGGREDYEFIFKSLTVRLPNPDGAGTRRHFPLGCRVSRMFSVLVELWNDRIHIPALSYHHDGGADSELPSFDTVDCDVLFESAERRDGPEFSWRNLFDFYPLSEVRAFAVDSSSHGIADWKCAIKCMPKLEEVEIIGDDAAWPFLDALRMPVKGQVRTFPNLQVVVFVIVSLDRRHKRARKREDRVGSMVHRVIQELEIRKNLGIPIRRLIFSGAQRFFYRRKDAPRIRSLVDSFEYSLEWTDSEEECGTCGGDSEGEEVASEVGPGDDESDDRDANGSADEGEADEDDGGNGVDVEIAGDENEV